MIAKYGSYWHDQSELGIRAEYHSLFDTFRRRIGEKIRFTCIGVKRADDVSSLDTKLNALFAAYQSDYQDFTLFQDDGVTPTILRIDSSETFGGVKVVVPPSQIKGPWSGQPEFAGQKTYFFVLEAETRVGTGYYAWKQRLRVRGSTGPLWRYSPQMTGLAQYQTMQAFTTMSFVQEGSAVGRHSNPAPDPLLYDAAFEHGEQREVVYHSAENIVHGGPVEGISEELFRTDWRYVFESTSNLGFTAFSLPGSI